MENQRKRRLLNMSYYALVSITILLGVIFMIYLATQTMPLYAKISLWILTDIIIGLIIFDIVCTNIKRFKFIVGVILYIISLTTFMLSIIVYISLSTNLVLTATQVFPYLALFTMSWMINIFTIIMYLIGLKLVGDRIRRTTKA